MQRRRFKPVKEKETIKPLHPRSTNVKAASGGSLVKHRQSLKRFSVETSNTAKRRKRETPVVPPETGATIFENDHVQLRLQESEELLPCAASIPQRLNKMDEGENSLQLEDFDQPPASTSTPLSASKTIQDPNYAFQPQMFYNQPMDDSPLHNNHYAFETYPYANYIPMRVPPQYSWPQVTHIGYSHLLGPVAGLPMSGPVVPTVEQPMDLLNMCYPAGHTMGIPYLDHPYLRTYGYTPTLPYNLPENSQSSSYKSSGGNATYEGSDESLKKR